MKKSFKGSYVALITPFKNGKVDYPALRRLVDFQIQAGTSGIVPCGTTGESPTLTHDEHKDVIAATVEAAAGRVPVIAGTGSNSTDEAVELTQFAQKARASAVLSVVPYYNKPTQEGMYQHFSAIASKSSIPIILYNIPGRCGAGLTPKTIARLAQIETIVGVKESTGSMDQTTEILSLCDIEILSGDDSLTLPLMSLGAVGVISVFANIFPDELAAMVRSFLAGRIEEARKIHYRIFSLCRTLFIETNPIPVKEAMKIMNLDSGEMRLPLCPMGKDNLEILKAELKKFQSERKEKP